MKLLKDALQYRSMTHLQSAIKAEIVSINRLVRSWREKNDCSASLGHLVPQISTLMTDKLTAQIPDPLFLSFSPVKHVEAFIEQMRLVLRCTSTERLQHSRSGTDMENKVAEAAVSDAIPVITVASDNDCDTQVTAVEKSNVCSAPCAVKANITSESILLRWKPPASVDAKLIDKYDMQWRRYEPCKISEASTENDNKKPWNPVAGPILQCTCMKDLLSPGTNYEFKVRAHLVTRCGWLDFSPSSAPIQTLSAPPRCSAPRLRFVHQSETADNGSDEIDDETDGILVCVHWRSARDCGSPIVAYRLEILEMIERECASRAAADSLSKQHSWKVLHHLDLEKEITTADASTTSPNRRFSHEFKWFPPRSRSSNVSAEEGNYYMQVRLSARNGLGWSNGDEAKSRYLFAEDAADYADQTAAGKGNKRHRAMSSEVALSTLHNDIADDVRECDITDIVFDKPSPICLGSGGFGTVVRSAVNGYYDAKSGKHFTVAVKKLFMNCSSGSTSQQQQQQQQQQRQQYQGEHNEGDNNNSQDVYHDFVNEVRILSRLNAHPNLLTVYAYGGCTDHASRHHEQPFLVTEFCDLGSLDEMIFQSHSLSSWLSQPANQIDALQQIAAGLQALHTQDPPIIHRDLKPANILASSTFGKEGGVTFKIADFGMARMRTVSMLHTRLGGSFPYISPECFRSDTAITEKVDMYAFACIAVELLGKQRCWAGLDDYMITLAVAVERRRPPLPVKMPGHGLMASLICECWRHDAEMRPKASSVLKDLDVIAKTISI